MSKGKAGEMEAGEREVKGGRAPLRTACSLLKETRFPHVENLVQRDAEANVRDDLRSGVRAGRWNRAA